jgi:hypothetical protein
MKKILCALFTAVLFCTVLTAQESAKKEEKDASKWASISYVNVPIYKILESQDAYVIIYGKNRSGSGSAVIPKKWAVGDTENPRKLKFRTVEGKLKPFMTVVKKDNTFIRVILSVPTSKSGNIWGIANASKVTNTDKDTLEDLAL